MKFNMIYLIIIFIWGTAVTNGTPDSKSISCTIAVQSASVRQFDRHLFSKEIVLLTKGTAVEITGRSPYAYASANPWIKVKIANDRQGWLPSDALLLSPEFIETIPLVEYGCGKKHKPADRSQILTRNEIDQLYKAISRADTGSVELLYSMRNKGKALLCLMNGGATQRHVTREDSVDDRSGTQWCMYVESVIQVAIVKYHLLERDKKKIVESYGDLLRSFDDWRNEDEMLSEKLWSELIAEVIFTKQEYVTFVLAAIEGGNSKMATTIAIAFLEKFQNRETLDFIEDLLMETYSYTILSENRIENHWLQLAGLYVYNIMAKDQKHGVAFALDLRRHLKTIMPDENSPFQTIYAEKFDPLLEKLIEENRDKEHTVSGIVESFDPVAGILTIKAVPEPEGASYLIFQAFENLPGSTGVTEILSVDKFMKWTDLKVGMKINVRYLAVHGWRNEAYNSTRVHPLLGITMSADATSPKYGDVVKIRFSAVDSLIDSLFREKQYDCIIWMATDYTGLLRAKLLSFKSISNNEAYQYFALRKAGAYYRLGNLYCANEAALQGMAYGRKYQKELDSIANRASQTVSNAYGNEDHVAQYSDFYTNLLRSLAALHYTDIIKKTGSVFDGSDTGMHSQEREMAAFYRIFSRMLTGKVSTAVAEAQQFRTLWPGSRFMVAIDAFVEIGSEAMEPANIDDQNRIYLQAAKKMERSQIADAEKWEVIAALYAAALRWDRTAEALLRASAATCKQPQVNFFLTIRQAFALHQAQRKQEGIIVLDRLKKRNPKAFARENLHSIGKVLRKK